MDMMIYYADSPTSDAITNIIDQWRTYTKGASYHETQIILPAEEWAVLEPLFKVEGVKYVASPTHHTAWRVNRPGETSRLGYVQ